MNQMTRENLIESARALTAPSKPALAEFSEKRETMASAVNWEMGARPDLEKLVGKDGAQMSQDNNRNFSLFMESLFQDFQPQVLVDTVLWVFRAYRAHGFQTIYWPANLDIWVETLRREVSETAFAEIFPFYRWLITHIPVFVKLTDTKGDEPAQTGDVVFEGTLTHG